MLTACTSKEPLQVTVYETSAAGSYKLTEVSEFSTSENPSKIQLSPDTNIPNHHWFWGLIYGIICVLTKSFE